MISEATIKGFLNRKLPTYDWLKETSTSEVEAAVKEIDPDLGSLWLHQKVCILLMQQHPRFMFHIDMGGGKTGLILTFQRLKKQKDKAIVFVPYVTAVDTWIQEAAKWAPALKCQPLIGTIEQNRYTILNTDADIYPICYQSAVAFCTGRETVELDDKTTTKWVLDIHTVKQYFSGFDTLILDEIQRCSNVNSLTYRMCRVIAKEVKWCYGLTGTPFSSDLQDLWPQFYLIDFGETLGPTLGFYREVFFTKKQNYWGGVDYKFKKKLMPSLTRMIKNKSIRYRVDEFADMPTKQYLERNIPLPEGIKAHVEKAKEQLHQAIIKKADAGQYELIKSAYLQLRQLSSGFMTFKDDESRIQIDCETNPKLDVLIELIESLPPDSKMVVFHDFVYSNLIISNALKKLKINHARIWGGQRDPLGQLKLFREDPECRILVINSRSGSASLNLQFSNYICFYEQPSCGADRAQAEARVWRSGQKNRVVIYDLFVSGTYDKRIFLNNQGDIDTLRELLDGKQEV